MDKRLIKTKAHKEKIRKALLGHKMSDERKLKISNSLKGRFMGLESPHWRADKNKCSDCGNLTKSIYAKRCSKCYKKYHRGEKIWNYDGNTPIRSRIRSCVLYFQWRSDVFERDNWTCQTCHKRGGWLEAHHIKEFAKIIKEYQIITMEQAIKCLELWDINNGVTLCLDCHKLTKIERYKIKKGW